MIQINKNSRIYLYASPVDMRKAIDGLSILLIEDLSLSPSSGDIYLFRNAMGDKVKALLWDRNGFILHYKRLERGRFKWPKANKANPVEINEQQLSWLFAGLDFMLMEEFSDLNFENYF